MEPLELHVNVLARRSLVIYLGSGSEAVVLAGTSGRLLSTTPGPKARLRVRWDLVIGGNGDDESVVDPDDVELDASPSGKPAAKKAKA